MFEDDLSGYKKPQVEEDFFGEGGCAWLTFSFMLSLGIGLKEHDFPLGLIIFSGLGLGMVLTVAFLNYLSSKKHVPSK